jgi:hypothetical protein
MDEQLIFIWNGGPFAKLIEGYHPVITSFQTLSAKTEELSAVNGVFVLAELNWQERHLTKFYGFDIIRKLREHRELLCPIVVCSFMPEEYFVKTEDKNRNRFQVLGKPGHSFLPLPFLISQIKQSLGQQLTEEQLEELIAGFYTTYEVFELIGTQNHPGPLILALEDLARGLRQFTKGQKDGIHRFPFKRARDLRTIRRRLTVTVQVLIESSTLLDQVAPVDIEKMKEVLKAASALRSTLDLLTGSVEDFERTLLLKKLYLDEAIDCLETCTVIMRKIMS